MKKAVIYARFSSDQQREESIEAQVRACKSLCLAKGYLLTNIYADEAKSGRSTMERDQYNKMLEDAKEHKFDIIVMHKIDRNARNEFDYFVFKQKMARYGIRYEYAAQTVDSSPEGQMMEGILVNFAAYYSRNLAKETKKGLNENAYKAQFNGGTPPFGYDINADKHYIINEYEAEAVRLIFRMYMDGKGYTTISHALNARGYKTKQGKPFGKNSLFDILRNEKYIGVYTFNAVVKGPDGKRNTHSSPSDQLIRIEDALPSIVDKALFFAVQEKRKLNKGCAKKFQSKRDYLLTGKIFCKNCGSAMNGHTIHKDGKEYVYYSCTHKHNTGDWKCATPSVPADLLEDYVLKTLKEKLLSRESITKLAEFMEECYEKEFNEKDKILKQLQLEKSTWETKIKKLLNFVMEYGGNIKIHNELEEINEKIDFINKKIDEIEKTRLEKLSKEQILSVLDELKLALENVGDQETKKTLVTLFVTKVSIDQNQILLYLSTANFSNKMVPRTQTIPIRKYDMIIRADTSILKAS